MSTALRIEDLTVAAPAAVRPELGHFSLTLEAGQTVVLLGESGCGKEALMRVLAGLPFRGEEIGGLVTFGQGLPHAAGTRPGPSVAYWPGPHACALSPDATVLTQLLRVTSRRLRAPRASARAELELVLGRMDGAPDITVLDALPEKLDADIIAWGLLAAAMVRAPELLLADQPLGGLPPRKVRALAAALKAEQARLGFAMIYAAMGLEVTEVLDARTLVMRHGRVVEEGPIARLAGPNAHAYTRTLLRDAGREGSPRNAGRGEPVLQVRGLEFLTGPGASEAITFELRRGAGLALIGEESSGRRALVRKVIGLDRAPAGRVVLDAVDIGVLSETMMARLRRRISFITGDDDALDPRMTLWDTVAEPLRTYLRLPRDIAAGYGEAALKRVGLASLPDTTPVAALAPFDKRRLQVARAIVTAPLLAVMDEPLKGLDAFAQSVMRDLLATFRREEGPAVIVITADFAVARALAETVFVFDGDRVVERGGTAELLRAPKAAVTRLLAEAALGLPVPALSLAGARR